MKTLNNASFVNSLAEITQHDDQDIIERSLLQTLTDFAPNSNHWLYRIIPDSLETNLALISYAKNNIIDTLDYEIREKNLPEDLKKAINKAVKSQSIQVLQNSVKKDLYHFIYPAMNKDGAVFAVLIQDNPELEFENQSLIHGLLKVYSNYLQLIDKTKRDKLTGLLNRETLNSEITRILIRHNSNEDITVTQPPNETSNNRKAITKMKYWLAILDIDFFKKINDTYGHLYGDDILILVSRLMESTIRDYDMVFRYGGEEFVIILVTDSTELAIKAFERIRLSIHEHQYAKLESLSVSIGATRLKNQIDPSTVLDNADTALYYAKEHGRNQFQLYENLVKNGEVSVTDEDFEAGEIEFF